MLSQLSIINYALIENVEIKLKPGLTALTGETGSGKSILLGALGLLLGQRADLSALRNPDKKCVVEAVFLSNNPDIIKWLKSHDLDTDDEITIRREIAAKGKSRAFINDTPVTLELLGEIGRSLVDIHSQHESLLISGREFLFPLLDEVANQKETALKFSRDFSLLKQQEKELESLLEAERRARMDEDYFRFQRNELQAFDFEKINLKAIEEELETLGNAEEIKRQLQGAWTLLQGNDGSTVEQVSLALSALMKVSSYNSAIAELTGRLEIIKTDLKEISRDIEKCDQTIIYDEERIRELENITGKLFELQQKHRLNHLEDLVALKEDLSKKLSGIGSLEESINACKDKIAVIVKSLEKMGKDLHVGRKKAAASIAGDVSELLSEMQMPFAALEIDITVSDNFNEYGKDQVNLMFRANKGAGFKPVQKVASGGELSRIMLALKATLSKYRELPTLILDEIDSGVSGEVAARMGKVMKGLTSDSQVIAITHLPQIAGMASHHFKVYKEIGESDTTTHVIQLKKEERVREIAALLSGTSTSVAALEHARILLGTP